MADVDLGEIENVKLSKGELRTIWFGLHEYKQSLENDLLRRYAVRSRNAILNEKKGTDLAISIQETTALGDQEFLYQTLAEVTRLMNALEGVCKPLL